MKSEKILRYVTEAWEKAIEEISTLKRAKRRKEHCNWFMLPVLPLLAATGSYLSSLLKSEAVPTGSKSFHASKILVFLQLSYRA